MKKRTSFYLSGDALNDLRAFCKESGLSQGWVVDKAIKWMVERLRSRLLDAKQDMVIEPREDV